MILCTVAGRIGKDAVLRNVNGGQGQTSVANFSVGCDTGYGDRKKTEWVNCALWGKRGESLSQYLLKGTPVTVVGEMTTREWTNQDGQTKTSLDMRVIDVTLQGRPPESQPAQQRSAPAASYDDSDVPF